MWQGQSTKASLLHSEPFLDIQPGFFPAKKNHNSIREKGSHCHQWFFPSGDCNTRPVASSRCNLHIVEPQILVGILPARKCSARECFPAMSGTRQAAGLMSFFGLVLQCFLMASILDLRWNLGKLSGYGDKITEEEYRSMKTEDVD